MKKATFFLFLIGLCVTVTVSAQNHDDFEINENGIITAYNGWDANIVIPAQIGGRQVTGIANEVFRSMGITGVTFAAGIQQIGERAFYNNKITSVTIPDGVTVGRNAFEGNQLVNVITGNRVAVNEGAFTSNQITGVTLGNQVSVGDNAFSGNQISRLTMGSGGSLTGNSFYNNRLTDIVLGANNSFTSNTFGSSVYYDYYTNGRSAGTYNPRANYSSRTEGDYTFIETQYGAVITGYRGSEINRLMIPGELNRAQVRGIGDGAFQGKNIGRMLLPENLTFIGNNAFNDNRLTTVTIPNSVTYIGNSAFARNQLENITIPDSVLHIGGSAFSGNQSINISFGNRRVLTIDMWDSYGDGWDGSGALRVTINGSESIRIKASGSNDSDFLFINPGDLIAFYWIEGSSQSENAFVVYYKDNPPNPPFNPSSGRWNKNNNDRDNRVLLYRQYDTMDNLPGGTLLGSFTAR